MSASSIHLTHAERQTMGRRVWRARLAADLTIAQVAAACGVSKTSVFQWQTGARPEDSERRAKLAALVGVPEAELFAEYESALAKAIAV